jgi:type IV pilus assembly protein PilW
VSGGSRPRASRGFSMVELMVAITLALVVSAALLSVFLASRSSFRGTAGTAAVADGGRFALDFISNSVRSAGFMACNTTQRQLSILAPAPSPVYANFSQALLGYEAVGTAPGGAYSVPLASNAAPVAADTTAADWLSPAGIIPAGLDPALISIAAPAGEIAPQGQITKNNDVLVVYSTMRNAQPAYVTNIANGASNFTVNAAASLSGGQLATISDCAKSVVMWISSVGGGTVNMSSGGWPNNSTSSLPVSFEIGSQVEPVDTTVFYIGVGADGDGALFSLDLNGGGAFTASELVPDIEAMQILYGVDTTGTQTVGEYLTADQVVNTAANPATSFNNVISVKIAVLAASQPGLVTPSAAQTYNLLGTTVTAPQDSRARQVFEVTVSLRNLAP